MSTTKPRITVTLTDEQYEVINGISKANGQPMSKLIGEVLQEMVPVFRDMLDAMTRIERMHREGRESLRASLERGQAAVAPLVAGAVAEWENLTKVVEEAGRGGPRPVITGATSLQRRGVKKEVCKPKAASSKARRHVERN